MVRRATVSAKDVTATWLCDGTRKVFGRTFNGTHASHLLYLNGVDQNATDGSSTSDPGTGTTTGALHVGNYEAMLFGLRGLFRELIVYSSAVPAEVMLALSRGIAARAQGAF